MSADYRLGRWQDVLADVECDALIFDAPYGERTHRGHDDTAGADGRKNRRTDGAWSRALGYDFLTPRDVRDIVGHWAARTRGWFCTITSHDLIPHWEHSLRKSGRYVFAPLPILEHYKCRMAGDGPGSIAVWMVVARPKSAAFLSLRWGSPPGHYQREQGDPRPRRMGGKSLSVMRAIVSDYSRPGDVVGDPFGGDATTLRAAVELGRHAVGCEVDRDAWAAGLARLHEPVALELFGAADPVAAVQSDLWTVRPGTEP